jgi:hypothetical protein
MIKKTVTYENFNGKTVTEDFYFHLSKTELIEMQFGPEEVFSDKLQEIITSQNNYKIVKLFKMIVLQAYGIKSKDGREFRKSKKIRRQFSQSAAYPEIFMGLAEDADSAAEFVNGIMPITMPALETEPVSVLKLPEEVIPKPTEADLSSMSREDLIRLAAGGSLS